MLIFYAVDDGAGVREDVLPVHEDDRVHEAAPVHDPCPSSDVLVDEVHGSENKVPFFLVHLSCCP